MKVLTACGYIFLVATLILALSAVFLPMVAIHLIILADFFTPFSSMHSDFAIWYQNYALSQLKDVPESEVVELRLENATKESLRIASRDYSFPVVIRGAMKDCGALEKWNNVSWWVDNYGDEEVLCKYADKGGGDAASCTIRDSLVPADPNNRLYISGEARLFSRRPELAEMVSSPFLESIAPGTPVFTQVFMGYVGMGSDVHSAMGCNMFRQIVGEKKWYLFPPSQTPFIRPSLNPNGFSAHALTRIGKGNDVPSPWMSKLERYTVTLKPGDVMLNPPWFWHGIDNVVGADNGLVIGVPTRYATPRFSAAFRSNWLLSTIGVVSIARTYGIDKFLSSPDAFQSGIERARSSRAGLLTSQTMVMSEEVEKMNREL